MTSPLPEEGRSSARDAFVRGKWLVSTTGTTVTGPTTFHLYDREWDLLPGVFAPPHCLSTRFFADSIPYPGGGSLLDVGCGTGVISVIAALRGRCSPVTAVDISPAAVENTRLNVTRHGLSDRITVLRSDLFDALPPRERFDLIFWNSPFIAPPADFAVRDDLDRAVFDPGYRTHGRFLSGARQRLTTTGRLLLGFSSLGDHATLARQADEAGYGVHALRGSGRLVPGMEYQLLELVPHRE